MTIKPRFNVDDIHRNSVSCVRDAAYEQPTKDTPPPPRFARSGKAVADRLKQKSCEASRTKAPKPVIEVHPSATLSTEIPPDVEAHLQRVLLQITHSIINELCLEELAAPTGNDQADFERLTAFSNDRYCRLVQIDAWLFVFVRNAVRSTIYCEAEYDRTDNRRRSRATAIEKRRKDAVEKLASLLLKDFSRPVFIHEPAPAIDEPTERNHSMSINDHFHDFHNRIMREAHIVAQLFIDDIRNGVRAAHFHLAIGRGGQSPTLTFNEHRIVDTIEHEEWHTTHKPLRDHAIFDHDRELSETTQDTASDDLVTEAPQTAYKRTVWCELTGTQRVQWIIWHHELRDPRYYDFRATLECPSLDIPPNFRSFLNDTPEFLRQHLSSLFGVIVRGKRIAIDTATEEITHDIAVSTSVVVPSYAADPCVIFADSIILFGWGTDMDKNLFQEHQNIVDMQRRLLDQTAAISSASRTFCICGFTVAAVTAYQMFPLSSSWSDAIPAYGPFLGTAALFILYAVHLCSRAGDKKFDAGNKPKQAYKALVEKYPSFDPSVPRLAEPEKKQR